MGTGSETADREALLTTVAAALRQQSRQSAHPADLAALRRSAARITDALEAAFLVTARHELSAELTDHRQLSPLAHE